MGLLDDPGDYLVETPGPGNLEPSSEGQSISGYFGDIGEKEATNLMNSFPLQFFRRQGAHLLDQE